MGSAADPNLIDAFVDFLLREKRYSEHTARAYATDVRNLGRWLATVGAPDPKTWTADDIRRALARVRAKRNPKKHATAATLSRKQSALRTFYRWLRYVEASELPAPTDVLMSPKVMRRLPRPIPAEAALRMMQPLQDNPVGLRNQAALILMYGLGLRLGEVAGLTFAGVNLDNGWVRVLGKGKKMRDVPLPAGCFAVLRAYAQIRDPIGAESFLVGQGGNFLSVRTIARGVNQAAMFHLGRHVSPHQLRHAFATHLLDSGANLREIQTLLGHANLGSTQKYTAVSVQRLCEAYDRAHPRAGRKPAD